MTIQFDNHWRNAYILIAVGIPDIGLLDHPACMGQGRAAGFWQPDARYNRLPVIYISCAGCVKPPCGDLRNERNPCAFNDCVGCSDAGIGLLRLCKAVFWGSCWVLVVGLGLNGALMVQFGANLETPVISAQLAAIGHALCAFGAG
jgi:hypothetical protein